MKKTKVMTLMATTTLGALALVPMSALAVDGGEYQTNGAIQFAPNTNPTNPVDPTNPDPDKPITPVDPTDPTGPKPGTAGPLSMTMHLAYLLGNKRLPQKYDLLCRNTKIQR